MPFPSRRAQPISFQPRRRWETFSPAIRELRRVLVQQLEDQLARPVEPYRGSDTFIYPPNNWSKYKLLPFDDHEQSPIRGRNEGVLVCLDRDESERTFQGASMRQYADLPWHNEPIEVRVGSGRRTYWGVCLAANHARLAVLRDLVNAIRAVEGHSIPA